MKEVISMCCTPPRHHGMKMMGSDSCCCQGMHGQKPMFWSKRKRIRLLQEQLDRMKDDVKDLEDHIAELQAEK